MALASRETEYETQKPTAGLIIQFGSQVHAKLMDVEYEAVDFLLVHVDEMSLIRLVVDGALENDLDHLHRELRPRVLIRPAALEENARRYRILLYVKTSIGTEI